jgi:hypothetical protein
MVMSKRERYIGFVTIAVLAVLVLDRFILTPATERMDKLDADLAAAQQDMQSAQQLFTSSNKANRAWAKMSGDTMRAGVDMESRVLNAVREWAQDEGMRLPSVIPQPAQQEKGFNKSILRATGSGSLNQIGRFLYRIRTASMPIRITDLQINATREGTDELSLNVGIATISPIEPKTPVGGGGATPQPQAASARELP